MGKLAEAFVDITPDMSGLDRGLGAALGKIRGFVGAGNGLLVGLGAGAGVAGVAAGLLDAAKAAADLGETVFKTKTVFGDGFGAVSKTADVLAEKFGLVKQETLDAASNIGLVTQAAGLSKTASADLAVQLTKLAADASSFYNVPMVEALEKIRSALVGESEPIRSFGVLLSEDAVKAEALRMGLTKTTAVLNDQQKVLARASLVMKGLATASGDLERTQDSAANQMRKLNGEIANLKADFGKSLTGPLTDAIKLARELGATLSKATGGNGAESLGEVAGNELGAGVNTARAFNKDFKGAALDTFFAGLGSEVAQKRLQSRFDSLAGVQKNRGGSAPAGPTDVEKNTARREAFAKARRDEALAKAQEEAKRKREAPAREAVGRLFDAKRKFDVSDAGMALQRQGGPILQAVLSGGLVRGGAGLLAGLVPEEEKKSRRTEGSAGVTSLEEAKRLSQTAALQRGDPKLDEQKKTNQRLDDAKTLLGSILTAVGRPPAAVARGRVDP